MIQTTKTYFLIVLESRSLKSRCPQALLPSEGSGEILCLFLMFSDRWEPWAPLYFSEFCFHHHGVFPLCVFPYKDHIRFNVCVCACSVVFNSLWPHGLWLIRLLCPWDFPGKNSGVGCHFLLWESSWPRDRIHIPCILCIAGRLHFFFFFNAELVGKSCIRFRATIIQNDLLLM